MRHSIGECIELIGRVQECNILPLFILFWISGVIVWGKHVFLYFPPLK